MACPRLAESCSHSDILRIYAYLGGSTMYALSAAAVCRATQPTRMANQHFGVVGQTSSTIQEEREPQNHHLSPV